MTALALVLLAANPAVTAEKFLGVKYVVSPLGEGEGYDPDPRYRTDAFDCLTFVETSMALTVSPDAPQATLDQIRYQGDAVGYAERNHVMEAQWLPRNLEKGFLREVTKQYGGDATVHVTKVLGDEQWEAKEGQSLKLDKAHQARGEFGIDLIPARVAAEKLKAAPDGTVFVVVRADRPRLVTRISHVGFLVHKKKGVYLRHASRTFGKVVDEELASYLARNLGYAKWTVEGFSLFEVTAPAKK
ncbi:MAG: DUF1460 domain-containing protein [Archangiaceae bacterium]|nr:DUF1460 domain-containing protein [Archangiaceae bacterium]